VSIRLTCVQRTISRSHDREIRETIVWRDEQEVPADRIAFTATGASIPVQFSLPPDALETTTTDKSAGILWSLAADAELPGVNLSEEFEVPVYRTGDANAIEAVAVMPAMPLPSEPVTTERLMRAGIDVTPTSEGTEYRFGAARNPSFALGTTAFTLLWTGALWLQWYLEVPRFFIVVTGLFELLLLFIVCDLWCGSTTVIVRPGAVRRRHSLLGLGAWRTIPVSEIASIALAISMQTSGRSGTPYYEIRVVLKNRRRYGLGDGIRSKRHAEWLLEHMKNEAGIDPTAS